SAARAGLVPRHRRHARPPAARARRLRVRHRPEGPMKPHVRRTATLAGLAALLLAVDLGSRRLDLEAVDELPEVAAVAPEAAARIRLTEGDDRIVLEREGETWRMTAPGTHRADPEAVDALLQSLRRVVRLDVQVGRGDLETYGLTSPTALRVEVEDAEGTRLADFYVGHDVAGGTTYLRFPDDDAVFRARLGSRARFDRSAAAWRDHRI